MCALGAMGTWEAARCGALAVSRAASSIVAYPTPSAQQCRHVVGAPRDLPAQIQHRHSAQIARPVRIPVSGCRRGVLGARRHVLVASVLLVAEPGGLQIEAALQPLVGCCADGPVFVEPGELGVLRADEVAAQFPFGQAAWFRRRGAVDAVAGVRDAGLQVAADPVDHGVGGAITARHLLEPGEGRLSQAQPGEGFLVARRGGPGDPGEPGQRAPG